jgi:putative hydrolase of the HAD superfamily
MRVHGRLRPKPSRSLLRKLLAKEGMRASRCVLVEDTVGHLKGAKALGMRTVWITQYLQRQAARSQQRLSLRPGYVDVKLKSVLGLPREIGRLRQEGPSRLP